VKFYFVRHGESKANIFHVFSNQGWKHGLTPNGVSQVGELAENLRPRKFEKIYTSPLKRAVETARILSARLSIEYEISDALREFHTGINEGKRDQESWDRWAKVIEDWRVRGLYDSRIERGESLTDQMNRLIPFIQSLGETYGSSDHNLLLIGHGGLFFCVLPLILENITYRDIENLDFPNTGYILVDSTPQGYYCQQWCGKSFDQFSRPGGTTT
jgi:broad specificity phosphatase PhoE